MADGAYGPDSTEAPEGSVAALLDPETLARARSLFGDELRSFLTLPVAFDEGSAALRSSHALISSALILGFDDISRSCIALEGATDHRARDQRYGELRDIVALSLKRIDGDAGRSKRKITS